MNQLGAEFADLVDLLGDVGRHGVQQLDEHLHFAPGDASFGVEGVDQRHHLGDGGVVLHLLIVVRDLFDGEVHIVGHVLGNGFGIVHHFHQLPDPVQEPAAAPGSLGGPGNFLIEGAHEHLVQAEGVRTDFGHDFVGVNDVAPGFGHLLAVGAQDHAVAGALFVGLHGGHIALIVQEPMPEPGIQQMQRGVLHAAVIPVHRQPVLQFVHGGEFLVVVGIDIPQEVPAGAGPLGHGVGFPLSGAAAAGAGGVDPVGHLGQRRFAVVRGLVAFHVRQLHRQLIFRHGHPAALVAMHQRDGLAPVPLAGEHPVAQLEVDLLFAQALFGEKFNDALFGVGHLQTVEEIGIDHHAVLNVGVGRFLHVAAGHHFDNGQIELLGEFPVALVVGGHGHDGTGAVAHQDVIGNPHGNLPAVDGVDGPDALNLHAGLVLVQFRAFEVAFAGGLGPIGSDFVVIGDEVLMLFQQRMLRRHDHIGGAEEGVRPGGEDAQLVAGGEGEIHFRALAAADPVALLHLDPLDEVHGVQTVQQLLGVGGDAQHPLGLDLADHLAAAAFALAAHHFFVGQADLAAGAPVDGHFLLIGQARLEQLQENPLGPLVILLVRGGNFPVVIEGEAQALELRAEAGDVVVGHLGGVNVIFDGEVLRGQAEGVVADGEQHVIALHAALTGDDVHGRIGAGMAHVQARARGIGELDEGIELGLLVGFFGGKRMVLFPVCLPAGLDLLRVVDRNVLHKSCSFAKNKAPARKRRKA